jgi:uncharacterized membrane protein
MKFPDIALVVAATFSALMAGLFFAYSVSVSPGLGKLSSIEYLKAMQSINRAILNPVFFLCFMGTLVMLPLAAILHFQPHKTVFMLLLGAAACYVIGVFGVTMSVNVPLNNMVDKAELSHISVDELEALRDQFEVRWNFWNNVRSWASLLAIVLSIFACIAKK